MSTNELSNKIRGALFVFLAVFTTCLPVGMVASTGWAVTYYVATTGNDSNPGTSPQPWKTIQKAANTMVAGDTVTVLAGSYTSERVQVTRSGSTGAPITFQAQGTVTMQGFTIDPADYVTIRGFHITAPADNSTTGWGIYYRGRHGIIENNHIIYCTRGGIWLKTATGSEANTSDCIVRNNELERNEQVGINVHGRNHLIENNNIWGTIQYHPLHTVVGGEDADGITYHGSGHTFRGNYIHDILYGAAGIHPEATPPDYNDAPHIDCFQTFATDAQNEVASDCTFEKNTCSLPEDYPAAGVGGKGWDIEGTKSGSTFINPPSNNIVIKNNVVIAQQPGRFKNATNLNILNNTFIGEANNYSGSTGVWLKQCVTTTIQNNIFAYQENGQKYIASDSGDPSGATLTAGYNCVYRGGGLTPTPPSYPHDVWNQNPQFTTEFTNLMPLGTSPCIDAGYTIASVTDDYAGTARPQGTAYDIGAYEFVSGSPNRPSPPTNLRLLQ